jgi:hypothetical protein
MNGLKAYQLITSKITGKRNPLALYIPYSDFVIERWNNYFLPALDAFRALGVPVDILPYAPRIDESVYPFYPIHHNPDVLERLLKEKTVLILANVSGFQQTDSDLIKAFVTRGGAVVAFGEQIPMGRSYDRKELFGGEELSEKTHTKIFVKNSPAKTIANAGQISFPATTLNSWIPTSAQVTGTYEDGSAAILVNKFGKGTVVTILPEAKFASRFLPELTRDVIDYALETSSNKPLVRMSGLNENFDVAANFMENSFSVVLVNHNNVDSETILDFPGRISFCRTTDVNSSTKEIGQKVEKLKLKIPANDFRLLECKF